MRFPAALAALALFALREIRSYERSGLPFRTDDCLTARMFYLPTETSTSARFTTQGVSTMSEKPSFPARRWVLAMSAAAGIAAASVFLGGRAISAQDKYTVEVTGGLAFSEFRGYEAWQLVSISQDGPLAAILANPAMIDAYMAGVPGNGKPFPDGSKMAKIHWAPKKMEIFPAATVPGFQQNADFMVKDSKRFGDSGGWGWAAFEYDAASDTFRPGTLTDKPPQGNDAKCGFACHSIAKARDYVFHDYQHR